MENASWVMVLIPVLCNNINKHHDTSHHTLVPISLPRRVTIPRQGTLPLRDTLPHRESPRCNTHPEDCPSESDGKSVYPDNSLNIQLRTLQRLSTHSEHNSEYISSQIYNPHRYYLDYTSSPGRYQQDFICIDSKHVRSPQNLTLNNQVLTITARGPHRSGGNLQHRQHAVARLPRTLPMTRPTYNTWTPIQ